MRGRSAEQVAAYLAALDEVAEILASGPATVREVREVLSAGGRPPAAATVYSRIAALPGRGYKVVRRRRRGKVPGKSGQRESTFEVVTE